MERCGFRATASNDTTEGRAMNRRVDLMILNSISDADVPTPIVNAPSTVPAVVAINEPGQTSAVPGTKSPFKEYIAKEKCAES